MWSFTSFFSHARTACTPKKRSFKKGEKKKSGENFCLCQFSETPKKTREGKSLHSVKNILIEGKLQELQLIRTKLEI